MKERKQILITVKTYPLPSEKYHEIVCTAGIDSDGNLIRLYPFPFRSMDSYSQFKKYQWIEVDTEKSTKDPRPESFKAFPASISTGVHIQKWEERRNIVLKKSYPTMCQLNRNFNRTEISLAIIKPQRIIDFKAIPCARTWTQKQLNELNQPWLLENKFYKLRKLPFDFKFKYLCADPACTTHFQTIEDWEIGVLYWKLIDNGDSEEVAVNKVREKFLNSLCSSKNDVHFFVGTHSTQKCWMIIGTFCPPEKFPTEEKGQLTFWDHLK